MTQPNELATALADVLPDSIDTSNVTAVTAYIAMLIAESDQSDDNRCRSVIFPADGDTGAALRCRRRAGHQLDRNTDWGASGMPPLHVMHISDPLDDHPGSTGIAAWSADAPNTRDV